MNQYTNVAEDDQGQSRLFNHQGIWWEKLTCWNETIVLWIWMHIVIRNRTNVNDNCCDKWKRKTRVIRVWSACQARVTENIWKFSSENSKLWIVHILDEYMKIYNEETNYTLVKFGCQTKFSIQQKICNFLIFFAFRLSSLSLDWFFCCKLWVDVVY
jgi:hypothetical protein